MSEREIISKRLLTARKAKNLTQAQAAEQLALDRSTIAKWETAKSIPWAGIITKVARLYGITVGYLMGEGGCENDAS